MNICNGNERSTINTYIGKLIMHLNIGINGINTNLFKIAHSLISIQINTYTLALNNMNVRMAIITQMTAGRTNSPTIPRVNNYIYLMITSRENIITEIDSDENDDLQNDGNYDTDKTGHGINGLRIDAIRFVDYS